MAILLVHAELLAHERSASSVDQTRLEERVPLTKYAPPPPETSAISLAGGYISVEHHGDRHAPVDMLFLHANGMNAATYRQLLSSLPPGAHVAAIDQRGHGLTSLAADPARREARGWTDLRDDLLELLDLLGPRPKVIAGHSMGATVALMAAAVAPVAQHLLLFDPVCTRPGDAVRIAEISKNRRGVFATRDEAFERLRGRGVFADWPDRALADYLDTGLKADRNGFELSCSPAWETSNFLNSVEDISETLAALRVPTTALLAAKGSAWCVPPGHPLPAILRLETVAAGHHFFPVTHPDTARSAMVRALAAASMTP